MLRTGDHDPVGHRPEGQDQLVVGQLAALPRRGQVNHPALQVDALNGGLDEPRGPQEGTDGEGAVAQVKGSGTDLEQQRRHDEEVVPAHQDDLDIRQAPAKPFQVTGGVDAAEAAAEDQIDCGSSEEFGESVVSIAYSLTMSSDGSSCVGACRRGRPAPGRGPGDPPGRDRRIAGPQAAKHAAFSPPVTTHRRAASG